MASPTHTKVQSLPAHRAATKDFLAIIGDVARSEGERESEMFSRFLTMAATACANPALIGTGDAWDRNEGRYMAEVSRFRHPETTAAAMAKALGVVTMALEGEASDFLGPIFSEISASAGLGQFFTPWHLCMAMAQMTLQNAPAILEEARTQGRRWISLSEPCCGAGGMALAANQVLREAGIDPAFRAHWTCVDIDWRCVCMTYIQLSITGASAVVVHGNVLSMETWLSMPTIMARVWPKRLPAEAANRTRIEAAVPDIIIPRQQLDLFA